VAVSLLTITCDTWHYADGYSLAAVVLEEPYDSHGGRVDGVDVWHAQDYGEQQVAAFIAAAGCDTDTTAVDPETKQEFEEMQKTGVLGSGTTNTASQIQNFDLASWMAGKTDSGPPSGRGQSPAAQPRKK
jgi:hypothetical protein